MRLLVARHGETVSNAEGIIQGHLNSELSARGVEQANDLAGELKGVDIDMIFSSDLVRAISTANAVAAELGLEPWLDWRLRERAYGNYEGTSNANFDWVAFWEANETESPNGAEPVKHFRLRLCSFMDQLDKDFGDNETILLVAHGGVLNQLRYLEDPDNFDPHPYENAKAHDYDHKAIIANARKVLLQ